MGPTQPQPVDAVIACIDACNDSSRTCQQNLSYCLALGGVHGAPSHIAALTTTARVCQLAVELMAIESEWYPTMCDLCAQVCEEFADACEELGDMDDCVEACQLAADTCRQVVSDNADNEDGDVEDEDSDDEDSDDDEEDEDDQKVRGERMN